MHGAGSPGKGRPGGRPRIHGAYSKVIRPEDVTTLDELRALGMGLEEEVALARLQLTRALEWANDERKKVCAGLGCPFEVVDRRLDLVAKVAERCKRVADGILVRVVDEGSIGQVVEIIKRHVKDPATLAAIAAELEGVGARAKGAAR